MKLRAQNYVLGFAALLCFFDSFLAPKDSDPGPVATVVMGILMLRRALVITPQRKIVIVAGCVLTALCVVGNHRLLHMSTPIWITLVAIAALFYGLWERIEWLWRQIS